MPDFDTAYKKATEVLSLKTKGPNCVMAYALVNGVKLRADGVEEPYLDPASKAPAYLAYAVCETDRVGVPVNSMPGGTQDVYATNPATGETICIELTKEKALKNALALIHEPVPPTADLDGLERHTLAKFIEKGWRVEIEPPFAAAVREAEEEHGIDITSPSSYIGEPLQFARPAITKRVLEKFQAQGGAVVDMQSMHSLDDIKAIVETFPQSIKAPQTIFAVRVPDFSGVNLVDAKDMVEDKIKSRAGSLYYEKGKFMTLAQMRQSLIKAIPLARQEAARGNSLAGNEMIATCERLNIFARIEACLVRQLRSQGVSVESSVPMELADVPDHKVNPGKVSIAKPPL